MIDKIRDLWILSNDGLVIFKRAKDEKLDSQLFGGFMSAINAFAEKLDEKGMSGFNLGTNHFMIRKEQKLLFVANYDTKTKPKVIEKEIDSVVKIFYNLYPKEDFDNWTGELTQFDKLNDAIEKQQKEIFINLKDSIW